jgi:hypothetical protein
MNQTMREVSRDLVSWNCSAMSMIFGKRLPLPFTSD